MNLLNLMILRNGKVQNKTFTSFETNILGFYQHVLHQNIWQKMRRRNSSEIIFHFYTSWKMSKQILPLQYKFNRFLQVYLTFLKLAFFISNGVLNSASVVINFFMNWTLFLFFLIFIMINWLSDEYRHACFCCLLFRVRHIIFGW